MGSKIAALAIAGFVLAGCADTVGLTGSFCDPRSGIEQIRLTAAERAALTAEPKRKVLAVNVYGEKNCGWKP
jgi:hypothetical protein